MVKVTRLNSRVGDLGKSIMLGEKWLGLYNGLWVSRILANDSYHYKSGRRIVLPPKHFCRDHLQPTCPWLTFLHISKMLILISCNLITPNIVIFHYFCELFFLLLITIAPSSTVYYFRTFVVNFSKRWAFVPFKGARGSEKNITIIFLEKLNLLNSACP